MLYSSLVSKRYHFSFREKSGSFHPDPFESTECLVKRVVANCTSSRIDENAQPELFLQFYTSTKNYRLCPSVLFLLLGLLIKVLGNLWRGIIGKENRFSTIDQVYWIVYVSFFNPTLFLLFTIHLL